MSSKKAHSGSGHCNNSNSNSSLQVHVDVLRQVAVGPKGGAGAVEARWPRTFSWTVT
jgi:hypothetical protein